MPGSLVGKSFLSLAIISGFILALMPMEAQAAVAYYTKQKTVFADSPAHLNRFYELLQSGDQETAMNMLQNGELLFPDPGSRVFVLSGELRSVKDVFLKESYMKVRLDGKKTIYYVRRQDLRIR